MHQRHDVRLHGRHLLDHDAPESARRRRPDAFGPVRQHRGDDLLEPHVFHPKSPIRRLRSADGNRVQRASMRLVPRSGAVSVVRLYQLDFRVAARREPRARLSMLLPVR